MKKILVFLSILFSINVVYAQNKSFTLDIEGDTLLMDNYIIAKFSIINTDGDFEAPALKDWDIVSGPNTSTMFSMVNGKTTRQSSYTYYLKPKKEGELVIEPAYLYNDTDTLETAPKTILVLPNPDGKIIEPKQPGETQMFNFSFPDNDADLYPGIRAPEEKKEKKKLKTRKL